jgi:P27 family predicted phage terminase small subunit
MGRRGPVAAPTVLKLIRGNPGQRSLNKREPQPTLPAEPPGAPETLTGFARQEWDRIIVELYRLKLVTAGDIYPLAAYCEAFKRWKTAVRTLDEMAELDPVMKGQIVKTQSGGAAPNPVLQIADKAARDMVRYAAEFGLTPASRSRITVDPAEPAGKFQGLISS